MNCCCNNQHSDLSLLENVLSQYKDVKGSLITILQKAQDIYGYLPTDVIYHVAKETGNTPAKVMGVATKRLAGKADGKAISAKVKELLS